MKFRCPNCANKTYTMKGDFMVCNICGFKVDQDLMKEELDEREAELNEYLALNKKAFEKSLLPPESRDGLIDEFNKLSAELASSMNEQVRALKESLLEDIRNTIVESLPEAKEASAEELSKLGPISVNELIERADSNSISDFIAPAALIRNDIENNLINSFSVPHIGKKFQMSVTDYQDFCNNYVDENGNHSLQGFFKPNKANYIDANKTSLEIPPLPRFVMAGLSFRDASYASILWGNLNRFIHPSDDNDNFITDRFINQGGLKRHFKKWLGFFKAQKLYTRD